MIPSAVGHSAQREPLGIGVGAGKPAGVLSAASTRLDNQGAFLLAEAAADSSYRSLRARVLRGQSVRRSARLRRGCKAGERSGASDGLVRGQASLSYPWGVGGALGTARDLNRKQA